MPLHPDIDGIISHLKINVTSADTLTRGLSREQVNWRTEPGKWSAGQCIMHLNLINADDLPRLESVIDEARDHGVTAAGPFRYGWLSRKFVSTMELPVTKRFSSPKPYLPPAEGEPDAILAEYRRISNELVRLAEKARGLDLGRIKAGLSGVPLIKMPLGARFSLLVTHDTRHLFQADQVMKDARFPK
jgi:hypothetical protein